MARGDPQIKLRLPAALKDRLESAARKSSRSLNAELVFRLERSFSRPKLTRQELQVLADTLIALAEDAGFGPPAR